ncbi:MAG: PAS domain-containing sensor histidine kinase [Acidimicrobiia bacterium]|jgi:PAS domain S-box-containing protein
MSTERASLHERVFLGATLGMLVVDARCTVIDANPAALRLLGYETESVIGCYVTDLLAAESAEPVAETLNELLTFGRTSGVLWAKAKDGSPLTLRGDAIDGEDGRILVVKVFPRGEVSETERRLHETEQRHRSLFTWAPVALREEDFSAVGVWFDTLRARGVVDLRSYMDVHPDEVRDVVEQIKPTRVNREIVRLLKARGPDEVLRGFRDQELTDSVIESFKNQFVAIWNRQSTYEAEFIGMNYDDEPFQCRLTWAVPTVDGVLDLSRMVVALLDLTDLRATERHLEGLLVDKDRFIANVSHELRTPLASVAGLSEELASRWDEFDENEAKDLAALVAAQAADLAMLVEDLLVAAHLETNSITVQAEQIDLRSVCEAAIADCARSDAGTPGVELSGQGQLAMGDAIRVRQIVRNLVSNAVRHGGDHISVVAGYGDEATVAVIDDGDGVLLEQRDSIFEAYYRREQGAHIVGSLGLGLAISRQLARLMGGELTYRYQDGRSVFLLVLPEPAVIEATRLAG